MKIGVRIKSIRRAVSIYLDDEDKVFTINGINCKMDKEEFKNRLLDIVLFWDEKMIAKGVIDGEEYSVKIKKENNVIEFKGYGKYPENYKDFIKLIEEVI